MSLEVSPRNSFDGHWGMHTESHSSTNSNINNNQSEIHSDTNFTDTLPLLEEDIYESKSNFDYFSLDWKNEWCSIVMTTAYRVAKKSSEEKRKWFLKAIQKLKKQKLFSNLQVGMTAIETIAMSPKISNLNKFYIRYDDSKKFIDNDPTKPIRYTEISLQHLLFYLRSLYPQEEILAVKGDFTKPFMVDLLKTTEDKPTYILYQFPNSEYKVLLILQLKDRMFHLNVLSSLGLSIYQESKYSLVMKYISHVFTKFFGELIIYKDFSEKRQDDESYCSAIIIDDMRIARKLISEGKSLERNKSSHLNEEFLKICKASIPHDELDFENKNYRSYKNQTNTNDYIEKRYLLPMTEPDASPSNPNPVLVNSKAALLSLEILKYYISDIAVYTSPPEQKISISDIDKRV